MTFGIWPWSTRVLLPEALQIHLCQWLEEVSCHRCHPGGAQCFDLFSCVMFLHHAMLSTLWHWEHTFLHFCPVADPFDNSY